VCAARLYSRGDIYGSSAERLGKTKTGRMTAARARAAHLVHGSTCWRVDPESRTVCVTRVGDAGRVAGAYAYGPLAGGRRTVDLDAAGAGGSRRTRRAHRRALDEG